MKKRLLAMTLAGAMAVGCLAGCGGSSGSSSSGTGSSSASGSAASSDESYKISVILKTTSFEFWKVMVAGCNAYEADHPNVEIDVKGPPSETSYDEQQNMIETDLANDSYDAYVIAPLQSDLVSTLISGETRPIIAVDTTIDAPEILAFVGTGNKEAAKQGAVAAVEAAKEAGWEEIECIEIAGVQGDENNTNRMAGFKEGVEESGGTFLDDEVQYAESVSDKAVNAMEAIMQTHPDGIAIVCANNEPMAVAAARTAQDNPAYDNTIFLGYDGETSMCESILDGLVDMSVGQQPYVMGYKACETAVAALNGETVSDVDTGCEIVTQDNAQARIDEIEKNIASVDE